MSVTTISRGEVRAARQAPAAYPTDGSKRVRSGVAICSEARDGMWGTGRACGREETRARDGMWERRGVGETTLERGDQIGWGWVGMGWEERGASDLHRAQHQSGKNGMGGERSVLPAPSAASVRQES
jgi:hypothetical protein